MAVRIHRLNFKLFHQEFFLTFQASIVSVPPFLPFFDSIAQISSSFFLPASIFSSNRSVPPPTHLTPTISSQISPQPTYVAHTAPTRPLSDQGSSASYLASRALAKYRHREFLESRETWCLINWSF